MDRFDLRVDVPPVAYRDLDLPASGPSSAEVAARVMQARARQAARAATSGGGAMLNADLEGAALEQFAAPDPEGRDLLSRVADRFGLSARGYHRILRVARTIADLEGCDQVARHHIAEAAGFRIGALRERA
jgi:magnesium chelatase family protein